MLNDTIVALSTAPFESALGVIRISGPKAFKVLESIFNKSIPTVQKRQILFGKIIDKSANKEIDEVLVSVFVGPHSFTGEDVVEISCHGGLIVINNILQLCYANGARQAQRGEFSQKAFYNGKIDLIQAESINDIITAKSNLAAEVAMSGLKGNVSDKIRKIEEKLLEILSHIEVNIDYPEYEDIEELTNKLLYPLISNLSDYTHNILQEAQTGKLIKEGIKVAIIGKPNAGKSSLLNALLDEDKAIVTDVAGTTRDVVEGRIIIEGLPFELLDTAGIREPKDKIEKLGVEKSKAAIENANIVLLVVDGSESKQQIAETINEFHTSKPEIIVINKNDISHPNIEDAISVSAVSKNVEILKHAIVEKVGLNLKEYDDYSLLSNARQIGLMQKTHNALFSAKEACEKGIPIDLIYIDMKLALDATMELLGKKSKKNLDEEVFSRFCIGK